MPDDLAAREWLQAALDKHGIDWEKLTPGQRFLLTREIPCSIRCWRVGVAVPVKRGERCPECGSPRPLQTAWDRIPLEITEP